MEEKLYSPSAVMEKYAISRNTLRLYEKNGLLPPSRVNESNSYRSYSESDLLRLETILLLKDTGMMLSEISAYLSGEMTAEQLKALLSARIDAAQKALAMLDSSPNVPGSIYTAPKVVVKDQVKPAPIEPSSPPAPKPAPQPPTPKPAPQPVKEDPVEEKPQPEPKRRRSDDFIIL